MRLLLRFAAIVTATTFTTTAVTAQDRNAEVRKKSEIVQKKLLEQIEQLKRQLAEYRALAEKQKATIAGARYRADLNKAQKTVRLRATDGARVLELLLPKKPGAQQQKRVRIVQRKVESRKRTSDANRREELKKLARLKAIHAENLAAEEKLRTEIERAQANALANKKRAEIELDRAFERRRAESRRRGEGPDRKRISAGQRLENIRAAIKHLNATGLTELAQAAGQRAENLQKELHAAGRRREEPRRAKARREEPRRTEPRRAKPADPRFRELNGAIIQLRKQVQDLQKSIKELSRRRK